MKICFYTLALLIATVSCKSPEARHPVTQNSGSYIKESAQRNRELVAQEEEYIQELIKDDSARDYRASNSGFWYYYNEKSEDTSNAETPEFGDVVKFDYSIATIDGNPIYPEGEKPTREYQMDKEELFTGLREGLKLMKEGETVTFLFPSHKAFGYYGDKEKIGTNVPITTKVTLHSITKENQNDSN